MTPLLKPASTRLGALLAVLAAVGYGAFLYHRPTPTVSLPAPIWIAHALGGIDGLTYTNSREAFLHNYARGLRLFEIDLSLTDSGTACARHHTRAPHLPRFSAQTSGSQPFADEPVQNFSLLCLDDLTAFMRSYPDALFILDIKEPVTQPGIEPMPRPQAFQTTYQFLHERWPHSLWQQIIPQIYAEEDLLFLQSLQHFPCVIHTLYREKPSHADVLNLMDQYPQIHAVAVDQRRFDQSLAAAVSARQRHMLIHTLNDPAVIHAFRLNGASGFFTDFHSPSATTTPSPALHAERTPTAPDHLSVSNLCRVKTE